MTVPKLPTRPDGGVDWKKITYLRDGSVQFSIDNGAGTAIRSAIEFAREAVAQTRERCAKWHDEQALKLRRLINFDGTQPYERKICYHEESAAAIRKMEG